LKTILYGTLVAKIVRAKGVVNAVSGLGIFFSKDKMSFLSIIIIAILRFSHNQKNLFVIFQNDEDKALFLRHKIIKPWQALKIKGSGIDLNIFTQKTEIVSDKIYILFVSRMIKEKGVFELIESANLLREVYIDKVQFLLCGGIDDNPNSLTEEQLSKISDGKYINWLGHRTDVKELLEQSHIVTLPSYYREGLPKSLIEACAIGRPIVTTNSIGCRDAVIEGFNGFLVPARNSKILAEKLEILINDKSLRKLFGNNSRKYAEENFSIQEVIEKHLEIYKKLLYGEVKI
jgi:glycosyltransferase involved in cell wall biosynthesis